MLQTKNLCSISFLQSWRHCESLPRSTRYRPGDPRPASTTGSVQTKTSTPKLEPLRPTVLDYSAPPVVCVGRGPHHCEAGDRSALAPSRFSALLALALACRRKAEDHRRDSSHDQPHSGRESGLGAPKIHGELLKLGFQVSERTVARYLRRVQRRGDPAKRWLTFLRNHREAIVALDFFTVPTIDFQTPLLLFRHRARSPQNLAHQYHLSSDWRVGGAAVA